MQSNQIKNIVIVGGGTAGWMSAAAISRLLGESAYHICLIESDEIGTVGVGEATIPSIRHFNHQLGIDEAQFVRETQATYKLGIEFIDWTGKGQGYIHPFGAFGHVLNDVAFQHYWLKAKQQGDETALGEYCVAYSAAKNNKFALPSTDPKSVLSTYSYAFHFDASLYADFLRKRAIKAGVKRIEGKVVDVSLRAGDGFIDKLTLADGQCIEGDLFIDCSGFRGILIEQALKTGYIDWSHWLPCDRAVAVQTENVKAPIPYTKAIAQKAGWQWQIPLQNRVGNGYVYCSKYLSDEEAEKTLLANIEGQPLNKPRVIRFKTGKRKKQWHKNCVAIGLSSGFLEPLESTSIHLIQTSISKLLAHFPDQGFNPIDIDQFNRQMNQQFDQVKNFLILHYKTNQRDDSPFWQYCQQMPIPDELTHRINLFLASGNIADCEKELFNQNGWLAVLLGQKVVPQHYHPRVDCIEPQKITMILAQIKQAIAQGVSTMPTHQQTLDKLATSAIRNSL